jgi:F1F0 ATPase subunit 2
MAMNESFVLILNVFIGVLLGSLFFGGLWWTVREGVRSSRPAILFLCSFFLRNGVVLIGFYFLVFGGHWERLVEGLFGFLIARFGIMRILKNPRLFSKEPLHAPQS